MAIEARDSECVTGAARQRLEQGQRAGRRDGAAQLPQTWLAWGV